LNSDQRWSSTGNLASQRHPDVYDNYVVYVDNRHDNWEVYHYNIDSGVESRVTNAVGNRATPATWGGRIVYTDDRNGNSDIYMTMVSYAPTSIAPPSNEPDSDSVISEVEDIKSLIADPSKIPTCDISGKNNNVKDNRRGALLNKLDAAIVSIETGAKSADLDRRMAHYQSAIDQLNSVLDKTDGCALRGIVDGAGSGHTPDWVISCASQALLDLSIRNSIANLQTLLEQD
jgi:beta propeller repeat protein